MITNSPIRIPRRGFFGGILLAIFIVGLCWGYGVFGRVPHMGSVLPLSLQHRFDTCVALHTQQQLEGGRVESCFSQVLVGIMKRFGFSISVRTFERFMHGTHKEVLVGQRCHAVAHEIGNAAARIGISAHTILTQCTSMCAGDANTASFKDIDLGCMNGAAHTWVLLAADFAKAIDYCKDTNAPQATREGCFHGLGHGLYERFGGDVKQAITQCLRIDEPRGQYQCSHAIFMEKPVSTAVSEAPMEQYCTALPTQVAQSCFEFAGSRDYFFGRNVTHAFSVCERAPQDMQQRCKERVGEMLYSVSQNSHDLGRCFVLDNKRARVCMQGFLIGAVNTIQDVLGSEALTACTYVPLAIQQTCFSQTGTLINHTYGEKVASSSCDSVLDTVNKQACKDAQP